MSVDLKSTDGSALCKRLDLDRNCSLQDVRDAIFRLSSKDEHDQRMIGAARASLAAYFEELTDFDDDLLVARGQSTKWSGGISAAVRDNALERYLSLLVENVLLREEESRLSQQEFDALRAQANRRGADLAKRLRLRYEKSGDAGDARVLTRAMAEESEQSWFLTRLRA
ncbi:MULTISPECIES: hypothetical protein [Mesorhizobium]|uniref:hypothetical protein n=1 Tax=Mesorhizobium TaxID=68287 RepID=UPI0007EC7618|nr:MULTISPECIES: hypothetical protein [Mesorhizobium]PBB52965.1 hypothetical protein CK223_27095 [Mesorhizobium loti]QIA22500.1 hypothetical protein A9K68_012480 [Mesorhizobium sp. AA22]